MALHTELDIYRSAFDLACAAVAAVMQMRRDAKPVVGRIMVDECFAIVRHIRLANMAADEGKETHLLQLLDSLTNVETALRISRDMRFIATPAYACLVQHTQSVGRQAQGWRNHYRGNANTRQPADPQGGQARALF